ncbi:MAG: gamma carbonic anhydrase family protein [Lautropia sp.]|nr:gamma carbonic anhydrase family protein [Lautropia sp.]
MSIYSLADRRPSLADTAWIAPGATVIGDVHLADRVGIWFGAVLRGDNDSIRIGIGSNVQENAVLHVDAGCPIEIGRNVTVGHQAMLHGCTIGDNSLIGIQAVVLNRARIGRNCLVGAGALVTEGKQFEDGWLILGSPAKAVRRLSDEEIAGLAAAATSYQKHLRHYATELKEWTP